MVNPTKAERVIAAREGGFVKRWHAERTLQEDMTGQHSHQMLVLGYLVLGDERMTPALCKAVTFHDAGHEKFVGDWPWGAKKPLSNNRAADLEHELADFFREKLDLQVTLTNEEAIDLAFLDLLEATMFAREEVMMGNTFMDQKAAQCQKVLAEFPQMKEPEIHDLLITVFCTSNTDKHPWLKELLG